MRLLIATLATIPLFAQGSVHPVFNYLQLTSAQQDEILRNNDGFSDWKREKERRIFQVRVEIAEETAREPLSPPALGLRYAEVESICREIDERVRQLVQTNQRLMNAEQRQRLSVLEEAMKLANLGPGAVNFRLIEGQANFISFTTSKEDRFSRTDGVRLGGGTREGACGGTPAPGFAAFLLGIPEPFKN